MKTDFDYQAVPQGFIHCFKNDCSRSDTCLRRLAARHCTADKPLITILSPAAVPADSSQCSYFLPIQKIRVAWGVRNLFDDVPLSLQPICGTRLFPTSARRIIIGSTVKSVSLRLKVSDISGIYLLRTALPTHFSLSLIRKSISGD